MPRKRHEVRLSTEERLRLEQFARSYRHSARERSRARILLQADAAQPEGAASDTAIAAALGLSRPTVERVRRRYGEGGLERALFHAPQANRPARKLDGAGEAHLVALVCGAAPEGHKRWSLRLLKDRLLEEHYVDVLSHETVRRTLKQTRSSRG